LYEELLESLQGTDIVLDSTEPALVMKLKASGSILTLHMKGVNPHAEVVGSNLTQSIFINLVNYGIG
jgi:hypothetical protein